MFLGEPQKILWAIKFSAKEMFDKDNGLTKNIVHKWLRWLVREFVRNRKLLFWYSSPRSAISRRIQIEHCHQQCKTLAEQCHTQIFCLSWAVPHSWIFDMTKIWKQPKNEDKFECFPDLKINEDGIKNKHCLKMKTTSKMKMTSKMKTTSKKKRLCEDKPAWRQIALCRTTHGAGHIPLCGIFSL